MANISIDYQSTIYKANQIKALSDKMLVVIAKVKRLEDEIQHNWQGEASKQYIKECETLVKYLVHLDLKISEFGDAIIKIANIIKQADESNAKSASGLSSGN